MTSPLISLAAHLTPILASLKPVPAMRLPPAEAVGLVAAEDIVAPQMSPPATVALRPGYAVQALELAGASPQSPVPLSAMPARVAAEETLPPGCDAILDVAALQNGRFGPEALEAVEPGSWVRLPGHDLQKGESLAQAGDIVTAEIALAAGIARIDHIAVRRPIVGVEMPAGPERNWLAGRLVACGARIAAAGETPDVRLRTTGDARPKLALAPGDAASVEMAEGCPAIALPSRFDAVFGAWCALVLPTLAKLSGTEVASAPLPLTRKIASAVGWTEIALLDRVGLHAHPLAVGDAPLGRIARANAFAFLDPGSEGAPAGEEVAAISLDRPFGRARSRP